MKIKILLTVYNDWENLFEISKQIHEILLNTKWSNYELVIINDGSQKKFQNIGEIKSNFTIINLIHNHGNQKAIAIGLTYIKKNLKDFDYLIILDCDGEDKPKDIIRLLESCEKNNSDKVIFAKRTKRKESTIFIFFYKLYKLIFKLLTKNDLDFGNFSCIPFKLFHRVYSIPNLRVHYSASVIKSKIPIFKVDCEKGLRFFGSSTMGLERKLHHGVMSLTLFSDSIAIKTFFASIFLMFSIVVLSIFILFIRLSSSVLILGWTSNFLLSLLIIFIIFLLISFFSISILILNKNVNTNMSSYETELEGLIEDISKN